MRYSMLVAALICGAACSSTDKVEYTDASRQMSDELVDQLEGRTDTRQMRLVVSHFQTSGHALRTTTRQGRVYYDTSPYDDMPERFRNQLIADLAQRVRVVDTQGGGTAILHGTVNFAEDERIVVQTRIIDTKTKEVLATANGRVR